MSERFFIIGCQRSGTTLMRLILDSHPDIVCIDEDDSYAMTVGEKSLPESKLVGLKIPVWTQHFPDEIPFYNDEKIIFMTRPVEDVVASMLELKLGDDMWVDSWLKVAMGNKYNIPDFQKKYAREIEVIGDNIVGLATLFWKEKNETMERLPNAHIVEYNRLVSAPTKTLRLVCEYLEIEWDSVILKHNQQAHDYVYPDGTTVGGTLATRSIDKTSVGRGSTLSQEDLDMIHSIIEIS